MSNCRDVEPLKAPYVDGEAAPDERSAVETHITGCGRCRDDLAAEQSARDVLVARRSELRTAAPAGLKARCASLSDAPRNLTSPLSSARPRPIYRRWMPMSIAATLLLALAGVFALGLADKSQALAFQMSLDHMNCTRNLRVSAADPAAAAERWSTRFGWPVRVAPSSQDPPLQFRGVRRCFVTDGRVAHLMYDWKGEPLSVYVLPVDTIRNAAQVQRFGHDAVMWSQNGRTYVVLSRHSRRPELDSVVQYVKANVY